MAKLMAATAEQNLPQAPSRRRISGVALIVGTLVVSFVTFYDRLRRLRRQVIWSWCLQFWFGTTPQPDVRTSSYYQSLRHPYLIKDGRTRLSKTASNLLQRNPMYPFLNGCSQLCMPDTKLFPTFQSIFIYKKKSIFTTLIFWSIFFVFSISELFVSATNTSHDLTTTSSNRLGCRRETRMTLCIIWNIGLLL